LEWSGGVIKMRKFIKNILVLSCVLVVLASLVGCESKEEKAMKAEQTSKELEQLLNEKEELESQVNAIDLIELQYNKNIYHGAGSTEISMTVNNNSDQDIRFMQVSLYEISKDGKVIQSDSTNSSNILGGASQSITTYFKFNSSDSTLKCEIESVKFK